MADVNDLKQAKKQIDQQVEMQKKALEDQVRALDEQQRNLNEQKRVAQAELSKLRSV